MQGTQLNSTDYTDQHNIVASGEQQGPGANTVKGIKSKKIANDKRTSTPYMTKYERARVLGTRALQIRYVQYWNTVDWSTNSRILQHGCSCFG